MTHAENLFSAQAEVTNGYVDGVIESATAALKSELATVTAARDEADGNVTQLRALLTTADGKAASLSAQLTETQALLSVTQEKLTAAEARIKQLEAGATGIRPTGANYVRIEDLGVSVNGAGLRIALQRDLGGKILTLPPGLFEGLDFAVNNSVFWASPTVGGLVGSGKETILGIVAGSSSKGGQIPTVNGATNPFYILNFTSGTRPLELGNFHLAESKAGHLHGGIQVRSGLNFAKVHHLTGFSFAPGNHWSPPGETFGLNLWHCEAGSEVSDVTFDGGGVCSSLIGYNDCVDTRTLRVDLSRSPYGMITWWQCRNVYTEDVKSYGGHSGFNHERVSGTIHHVRPHFFPDRVKFPSAMHVGFNSDTVTGTMLIEDASCDQGLRTGALMVMMDDLYAGVPQKQLPSGLTVKKGGVTLTGYDTAVAGTKPAGDPTKNYFIYR